MRRISVVAVNAAPPLRARAACRASCSRAAARTHPSCLGGLRARAPRVASRPTPRTARDPPSATSQGRRRACEGCSGHPGHFRPAHGSKQQARRLPPRAWSSRRTTGDLRPRADMWSRSIRRTWGVARANAVSASPAGGREAPSTCGVTSVPRALQQAAPIPAPRAHRAEPPAGARRQRVVWFAALQWAHSRVDLSGVVCRARSAAVDSSREGGGSHYPDVTIREVYRRIDPGRAGMARMATRARACLCVSPGAHRNSALHGRQSPDATA
jgi:hypothetical protein